MIKTREWNFSVSCEVNHGESVFLTGSCHKLGNWDPQNLIPLVPENGAETNGCKTVWRTNIHIPKEKVEYRFCVCVGLQQGNEVINCVKRWEADIRPRVIPPDVSNADDPEILSFGYIGDACRIDLGWLTKERALFLRLTRSNVHSDPIVLWKRKHKDKKCYIKVIPIDISKTSSMESYLDFPADESTEAELTELRQHSRSLLPIVEVSVLKEGATEFRYQDQFGVLCSNEEFVAFQCRLTDNNSVGFLMDFYIEMDEGETPKYVGCAFILPSTLRDTYGVANVPITSPKHIPIGQLTVSYMVVLPLEEFKWDMKVTYERHWKESWRGLDVGHRGAGNSFHSQTKNCANIRENTIASLKHAWESGADMVEFDVQLSKDLVPLIYHDFHACIALKQKKEPQKTDLMEVPIKDLTLAQLQQLKVYHMSENGFSRFSDEDFEDHQPFPTLEKAFESVPQTCGFNIEIKWTMRLHDGTYELQHPFELNRFLDNILKVVIRCSSQRKIIFSSFHPDICTMIRLKQNLYPVLFLTQGQSKKWPPYDDMRTKTIKHAVLYASSANILGINVLTEDLMLDPNQIKMAFDHNLIAFCWGDSNSDRETIRSLKGMGLHGIIYDKIDVYSTKQNKSAVFMCDDKETCRCFPSSCKVSDGTDQYEPPSVRDERLSPQGSNDNVLSPEGEPSPIRDNPIHSPGKRPQTPSTEAEVTAAKRVKANGFRDGGSDSLTSFRGILSQKVM